MKKIFIGLISLALFSCNMSLMTNAEKKDSSKQGAVVTKPSSGGLQNYKGTGLLDNKQAKRRAGYSIVKAIASFDKDIFSRILGAEVVGVQNYNDGYVYYLVKNTTESEAVALRSKLDGVDGIVYSQPDYIVKTPECKKGYLQPENTASTMGLDNGNLDGDPLANQGEYALRITKARNWYDEKGIEQKGAYTAVGYGTNEVLVAIIDTGLDQTHKDFKDIVLYGKSGFESDGITQNSNKELRTVLPTENFDGGHHGTHCAGTICALDGNNAGIAGVAYKQTKIIAYKALGDDGNGPWWAIYGSLGDLADIVTILRKEPAARTVDEKAKIPNTVPADFKITQKTVPVNMSLGGGQLEGYASEMVNKALAAGVLPVIAMGNDGRTVSAFPGAVQGVLSVGATTSYDTKAPFSNSGTWINICAPGYNIISSSTGTTDDVEYMSGTSMATPFVTGVITYLLSFDAARNLTPYQWIHLLENTADKIIDRNAPEFDYDAKGFSKYYGYGRVNVLEAAKALKAGAVPAVEARYTEGTAKFKVQNTNLGLETPMKNIKIYVYEKESNVCAAVGITLSDGTLQFPGLRIGVTYVAKVNLDGEVKEYEFTTSSSDVMGANGYTFAYQQNRCYISTFPNAAYPKGVPEDPWETHHYGLDAPWLLVQVYDSSHNLVATGAGFYHKLSFMCESGKAYYCLVSSFDEDGEYLGGNYGLYIGKEEPVNVNFNRPDGTRTKSQNDTYENNNSFDEADAKFEAIKDTHANGYWEMEIPANVVKETPASGNQITNKGDLDFYKFITPSAP